jgi:hypothetical protein
MKISQQKLLGIVRECIVEALQEKDEAPPDLTKKPDPKKPPKKDGPDGVEKKPAGGPAGKAPKSGPPEKDPKGKDKKPTKKGPPGPNDVPADDDVIDLSVDDFEDAPEDEEEISGEPDGDEGDDDRSGGLNRELDGKSFQSVSVDPKSKLVPGAKEVVVTFGDTPDPLRIVVTQSGEVKFFFRGSLHDLP